MVELVEVPALPPVPGRVLDRPRHWTQTRLAPNAILLARLLRLLQPQQDVCVFVQTGFCESERGMETYLGK